MWVLLALFFLPAVAAALAVPALRQRVTDLAGLLTSDVHAQIESDLAAHEAKTSQQFAVLTVPTLAGDPLEDFSMRVVEAWKLGRKDGDNGLLMLVAVKERKIRIEVGYGLEGNIPDALASRVVRNVMQPRFREGDYTGGIR
ncbi:MAG: TPM domain-containing protein, partial [Deltaproteobacteria bacterium]|nr:TPM domain-containing protein [Deltaproteobacteria bacterium]